MARSEIIELTKDTQTDKDLSDYVGLTVNILTNTPISCLIDSVEDTELTSENTLFVIKPLCYNNIAICPIAGQYLHILPSERDGIMQITVVSELRPFGKPTKIDVVGTDKVVAIAAGTWGTILGYKSNTTTADLIVYDDQDVEYGHTGGVASGTISYLGVFTQLRKGEIKVAWSAANAGSYIEVQEWR